MLQIPAEYCTKWRGKLISRQKHFICRRRPFFFSGLYSVSATELGIGRQYRGTKVMRYRYRGTFLVPVPSVLLWYRYRGTLLFLGGTGTLVLLYYLGRI